MERDDNANTSALQFDQEFGNTFFGTGDTLIDGETVMGFRAKNPRKVREGGDLLIYREPIKDHQYIMTVDVCKGRGQDYSTFSVFDISTRTFKQVAVYRNNTISPVLFPNIIYKYAKFYNECYVVIESMTKVCSLQRTVSRTRIREYSHGVRNKAMTELVLR